METQVCFVLLAKTYKAQQYGESIVAFPMTELPVDVEICLSKIQGNATLFAYFTTNHFIASENVRSIRCWKYRSFMTVYVDSVV